MMTNAGSSRAHWFFVCLWYDVCRYLRRLPGILTNVAAWRTDVGISMCVGINTL